MEQDKKILSDIITYMKYSKYLPKKQRRETWDELVDRNMQMHIKKYPYLKKEIKKVYKNFVLPKKLLPSMRSMQFAGKAIEVNNSRIFNCAYLPINHISTFNETMFLLLSGAGVGYSVQKKDISKLPNIIRPSNRTRKYVIQDSIMGWADSIKALMKSYMGYTTSNIIFDFSEIREKGVPLVTAGGKAPGPGPLKVALVQIENKLQEVNNGEQLSSLQIHDILCYIADAVLAGGIRRSAMISFFDANDEAMLTCKSGKWWESNAQRGRANNSVILERQLVDKDLFNKIWEKTKMSQAGEPGFYFTNDKNLGSNPCVEVSLKANCFCNLVEINGSTIYNQEDFNNVAKAASFLGTLQAGYTDFHYLREEWRLTTEEDALLGVSITGIANKTLLNLNFTEAAQCAVNTNIEYAKKLGINTAARITVIKPAGTTSLVLGTSSGIHAYHSKYYLRRIRLDKSEPLYTYLNIYHSELLEDDLTNSGISIVCVPQSAPESAITRSESSIDLLERVKKISNTWIKPGHISGKNSNNVSCTVSVREEEWDIVRDWMWVNKDNYNGISVLPTYNTYKQAPFESITKEKYNELITHLNNINLSKVIELDDNTNLKGEVACGGSGCEIK